jgi:hypothetical protein
LVVEALGRASRNTTMPQTRQNALIIRRKTGQKCREQLLIYQALPTITPGKPE